MQPGTARGLTLVEVMVVSALAMLVVLGMIGFYISSQSSWMAGSTQALAQRDATLLVEAITDSVRRSARAMVNDWPDASHQALFLYASRTGGLPYRCFYWRDSSIYCGSDQPRGDDPLVVPTRVRRFQLATVDTSLVRIELVELTTTSGQPVRLSSAAALCNR